VIKFDDGMIPDLDFPALDKHREAGAARPPRAPRPHVPTRPPKKPGSVATIAVCAVILALIAWGFHAIGRTSGLRYADAALTQMSTEASATASLYEQALDANEHLAGQAAEASATIDALASEVESATAAAESLRIQVEDLELLNAALKNELGAKITPQAAPKAPAAPKQTSASAWSADKVAATLRAAAAEYGLDDKQTEWIVATGVRVAYKESTYRPDARNGQYLGLFQFGDAWAPAAQRLDPVWSCYRFVRVYADGGEAKIRQHWASTIGGA